MNSLWKQRILDAYRQGSSPDKISKAFGYSVDEITKVLFPRNRPKITEAIVAKKPLPPNAVKKGNVIVEGEPPKRKREKKPEKPKDPKMVEAGRKAHLKRLENLKKAAEKEKVPQVSQDEVKEEVAPIQTAEKTKANRRTRREHLQKQKSKWVIDEPFSPEEIVQNTANTFIEEAKKDNAIILDVKNAPSVLTMLEQATALLLEAISLLKQGNKN